MAIDLVGKGKFGALTPIERYQNYKNKGRTYYLCRCDCGNLAIVEQSALKSHKTQSCGCYRSKRAKQVHSTHNHSKEKLYEVWKAIKKRCNCSTDSHYKYYGKLGVKVCDEWSNNYMSFREWAFASGYQEMETYTKYTVDRINPFGNYEPSNCRIADWVTQRNNRRANYAEV